MEKKFNLIWEYFVADILFQKFQFFLAFFNFCALFNTLIKVLLQFAEKQLLISCTLYKLRSNTKLDCTIVNTSCGCTFIALH